MMAGLDVSEVVRMSLGAGEDSKAFGCMERSKKRHGIANSSAVPAGVQFTGVEELMVTCHYLLVVEEFISPTSQPWARLVEARLLELAASGTSLCLDGPRISMVSRFTVCQMKSGGQRYLIVLLCFIIRKTVLTAPLLRS